MQVTPDPATLADSQAITRQIYNYCRSVDRLDVPLGHGVFHTDSEADFPTYKGTGQGWIDAVCKEHLNFLHQSHQVTNILIDVDGDRAGSEAYVIANLRQMDGGRLINRMFSARYIDKWSKRDGRWAIDRRDCIVDFSEVREVTALGNDERSARDASDPSYGVLKEVK
ncbi:MAG: nuclear transport factor 2 family protein [Novosphingobium sp.]